MLINSELKEEVSIPSSGSIQFLPGLDTCGIVEDGLKVSIPSSGSIQFLLDDDTKIKELIKSLNPLKRVNSILTI